MANNCGYDMKAVAKDPAVLERLKSIMEYKDSEYFIYRVFDVYTEGVEQAGDFYQMYVTGDVAWCGHDWFHKNERMGIRPYDKDEPREFTNLVELSGKLGFACEVFTEECGCEFAEHYVAANGRLCVEQSCEFRDLWVEDDDSLDFANDCHIEVYGSDIPEGAMAELRGQIEDGETPRVILGGYDAEFADAAAIFSGEAPKCEMREEMKTE